MERIIGAHVSASGGLAKAAERAGDLGCRGMQVFTGSPRVWKTKPASEFDVDGLARAMEKAGVGYGVIHATYLINLASDNPELVAKSRNALVNDLQVCAKANLAGVVVHLGSHQGRGYEAVRDQLVGEIEKILELTPEKTVFLIENSAGQRGKIGSRLEEIKDLIERVGSERLGWCFDTCHGFAAGYVLGSRQAASNRQRVQAQRKLFGDDSGENLGSDPRAVEEIERLGLWDWLKLIHVNDSRDSFGSGRDRHENLGEGEMGLVDLGEFLRDKRLVKQPLILEVPGFDGKGPDRENVSRLLSILR